MLDDVSVVVCTRNCLPLVQANLSRLCGSLKGAEFIIVDGDSTDGTKEFVARYAENVISDGGKGLAYARQSGVEHATRPYVLFAGCDNRLSQETVTTMAHALRSEARLAGVGVQTMVIDAHTYWEQTTKRIFRHLINRVGRVDIVGTPSMYKREVLMKIPFDGTIRTGDDTDVAYRLIQGGYELAIVDAYAEEKNALTFTDFKKRWYEYGKSDAEFYATHHADWGLGRRIQSFTHPLRKYGIRGTWLFLVHGDVFYIPGLWVATVLRYCSWVRAARKGYYGY